MKKYLIIILPFIIFITSCDEDRITDIQSESFIKYYGGSLVDEGIRVLSLENGGYLLLGNMETPDNGKQVCVIITDKFGNSVGSANLYGFKYNDYANGIKKNNKGYIIAGTSEENAQGEINNILLIQILENGTLDWIKTIQPADNSNEVVNDFLVLSDQSLVLIGYKDITETNKKRMILIKTDPNGNLNEQPMEFRSDNIIGTGIIGSDKSGYYLIAGYRIIKTSEVTSKKVFITEWQGYGNVLLYANTSDVDNAYAISIIPQEDGNYIVPCNVTSGDERYIKIIKVSTGIQSIEKLWEKKYKKDEQNIGSYCFSHNNKIFLVGTSTGATDINDEANFGNIFLLEMENDGNLPDFHYMGDGISFQGNGFDFSTDGGYIITGSNKLNQNSMITLIKLKSNYSL